MTTTLRPGARGPLRLGFLTHVHGIGRSASDVYHSLVDQAQAAEELGYDGIWIAQHHFGSDTGRLPSPLVLLAAIAQRTTTLRLGTGISALPLEDPIRYAEDAAVLDALSGGRVELGVGSGGANLRGFAAFGRDVAERRDLHDDVLESARSAFRGDEIRGTGLTLQPTAPDLAHRLWSSTSDPDRAADAARAGDGLLLGTAIHDPLTQQKPIAEAYLDAWTEPEPARIGVVRAVFPGASRSEVLADLGRGLTIARERLAGHWPELASLDDRAHAARLNVHYGTSDEITAALLDDPALLGYADWFIPVVQHELSTPSEENARLETIATEIAPRLGWERRDVADARDERTVAA